MDEATFWNIIESARRAARNDPERQRAAVRKQLGGLPPAELVAFQSWFNWMVADAYTWDLWGAAYLINGGCSDDGFAYFRCWLVSRGPSVYSAALRDPDTLARVVSPDEDAYEFEELWDVAREVYEEATGAAMPADDVAWPAEPKGERWDFDDDEQLARRLPRLARRYDD